MEAVPVAGASCFSNIHLPDYALTQFFHAEFIADERKTKLYLRQQS